MRRWEREPDFDLHKPKPSASPPSSTFLKASALEASPSSITTSFWAVYGLRTARKAPFDEAWETAK